MYFVEGGRVSGDWENRNEAQSLISLCYEIKEIWGELST